MKEVQARAKLGIQQHVLVLNLQSGLWIWLEKLQRFLYNVLVFSLASGIPLRIPQADYNYTLRPRHVHLSPHLSTCSIYSLWSEHTNTGFQRVIA